ncbi:MAG: response regulator, partial [Cyanobacteria bacterium P01_H01_bin.121]
PVTASGAPVQESFTTALVLERLEQLRDRSEDQNWLLLLEQLLIEHRDLASQGSTYQLALAAAQRDILRLLKYELDTENLANHFKILIVDDSAQNVRFLGMILQRHGFAVRLETSSVNSIAQVKIFKPDLILLDIMMPIMDGYEICKTLKEDPNTAAIPVIFISALNNVLDKLRAFRIGGADYITKPFQYEEVLVRVEHQLQIHAMQQRLENRNVHLKPGAVQHIDEHEVLQAMQAVVDGVQDYVLFSDPAGQLIHCSQSASQLLEYSRTELLELSLFDLDTVLNPKLWEMAQQRLRKKGKFSTKSRHHTKSGKFLDVALTLHPLNLVAQEHCCILVKIITQSPKSDAATVASEV